MSGFDSWKQNELNEWMAQTIQCAMITSGRDEVAEEEVLGAVHQALAVVPDQVELRGVVVGILTKAAAILWPTGSDRQAFEPRVRWEMADQDDFWSVLAWVSTSILVVSAANGRVFKSGEGEALADSEIIAGVLGNQRWARRVDLEEIVRKVVRWGLEYLTPVPEHGLAAAP